MDQADRFAGAAGQESGDQNEEDRERRGHEEEPGVADAHAGR